MNHLSLGSRPAMLPLADTKDPATRIITESVKNNDPWTALIQAIAGERAADVVEVDDADAQLTSEDQANG